MANEFLTFAGDPAANVMPIGDYSAGSFTTRLIGFVTGTALSPELNRVWRQSSLIASMVGSFTTNNTGLDMIDDGTPAGMTLLETNFKEAIRTVASGVVGSGFLPLVGGTLTGPLVVASPANQITVVAPAGQSAVMLLQRGQGANAGLYGATLAGLPRWIVIPGDASGETGGNAGSNFDIGRFDDAGNWLDAPLSIDRATGTVNFSHPPTFMGGPLPYLPLAGGNVTGRVTVGDVGIGYPSVGSNYHSFGWDGPNGVVNAYVDNNWVGSIATRGWSEGRLGNYLPLAGGTITGNLQVDGFTSLNYTGHITTTYFNNTPSFAIFQYDRYRYIQWQDSWGVNWDTSNGNTTWYGPNGRYMQLTGNFDLSLSGRVDVYGGRLMSIASASPTIVGWHQSGGSAMGFQVEPANMYFGWFDGAGNGIDWIARMDTSKNLQVYGGVYAQYIHSYGDIVASNRFWSAGGIGTAGSIDASGQIYAAGSVLSGGTMINLNGRLVTRDDGGYAPSVTAWNIAHGTAAGFWTDPDALAFGHLNGDGGPAYGQFYIYNDGRGWFGGNFNAGGSIGAGNEVHANGWVSASGGIYTTGQCIAENTLRTGNDLSANNNVVADNGWVYACNNQAGAILDNVGVRYHWDRGLCFSFHWDGVTMRRDINGDVQEVICGDGSTRVRRLGMDNRFLHWWDSNGWSTYCDTWLSDAQFKNNIQDAAPFDSLAAINTVKIRSFDWTEDYGGAHTPFGFVADELEGVLPDCVRRMENGPDAPENAQDPVAHVDAMALTAHLIRAVQQLSAMVADLLEGKANG